MTTRQQRKKWEKLLDQWLDGKMPTKEDLRGLEPEQAEALAVAAGYNTQNEMHVLVREGYGLLCSDANAGR